MNENATYYELLISNYLSGEASPKEISKLESWLKADPANMLLFEEMHKVWSLQIASQVENTTNLEDEWESMVGQIGITETPISRSINKQTRRSFLRIAAVFLLLIVPSVVYYWFFLPPGNDLLIAETQMIEATLSDGTEVALNAGSSLKYPKQFEGKERKVVLNGEAYFDVARNEKKAFIIDAEAMKIRVLGTSFYVNTQAENNTMEVVLMEGSVQLEFNHEQMMLEPGDKAIILPMLGEIVKKTNNDPNLLAWKTKTLRFDDTPIHQIIEVLQNVYHKEIVVLDPGINNCRITATFEGQSLEAVLLVLQSTVDITARPKGDLIELSGKGCQ